MNNVPIKSNLVPRKPPVEFQMPNSYQSQEGMQPYKPLGGSLERNVPGNSLRRQEGSQLEPPALTNRGYVLEGQD